MNVMTSLIINDLFAFNKLTALRTLGLVERVRPIGAGVSPASGPAPMISVIRSIMLLNATASVAVAEGKFVTWTLILPGDLVTACSVTICSMI